MIIITLDFFQIQVFMRYHPRILFSFPPLISYILLPKNKQEMNKYDMISNQLDNKISSYYYLNPTFQN